MIVTSCKDPKLPGNTASMLGTDTSVTGGVKVKLAAATSCPFRNPATAIVHCVALPTAPSTVLSAHPNHKEDRSKDLILDPDGIVRDGVPFTA